MAISLHTKLCDMLGIEYPVMAFSHCRDVAAAVSSGGGAGALGVFPLTPEELTQEIKWLRTHTNNKPFGVDLIFPSANPMTATREQLMSRVPKDYKEFVDGIKKNLGLPDKMPSSRGAGMDLGVGGSHESQMKQLDAAIKMKPAFIATALGVNREVVDRCHAADIKVISLVGNVKNALRVKAMGVDILVAQGSEAGGHTGRIGTLALVPQVVDAVAPTPVLAAGGIGDGRGLVAALALGAVGVWTGTIWLTSHESPLADWIKDKILQSTDEDAVITRVYTGKTARFLNNKYIEAWNQTGAPKTLPMPLQNLYSPMAPSVMTENPASITMFDKPELRDWVTTPAGCVMGLVRQRKSCRQIVYDMVAQATEILATQ